MNGFELAYDSYDAEDEGLRETLTSTGNGYVCSRGAAEWVTADEKHYPGTYVHSLFNRATTMLGGMPVRNEDLVNLPNWLPMRLRIEGADVLKPDDLDLVDYRHAYDLRTATLTRELTFRDSAERETKLVSRRFVSMAQIHTAYLQWEITPLNWSGTIDVIPALDGRVTNWGVPRYRELEGRHLRPELTAPFGEEVIGLKAVTRQSDIHIGEAARTRAFAGESPIDAQRTTFSDEDYIQQMLTFEVSEGQPVTVEKAVGFYTSRDPAISDVLDSAVRAAERAPGFEDAQRLHRAAWEALWDECDMEVTGDENVQYLLRVHISHILQVCSPHTADLDAGVPARGIDGEAYRGHIFWDELFVYPYLNYRMPEVTRGLLMYRYRRLPEAREGARAEGYRGAMYPWQSGSDGTEETQKVHLNPMSGTWDPDHSHNQRHVNAAIFYNIWHYAETTGDHQFLQDYGAEMMLDIVRFWASITHFNEERGKFEIHGVMGPDEFHESYPDAAADEGGINNNAYTNIMVAWMCERAAEVLEMLPDPVAAAMREKLEIGDQELETWARMSREMFVPFHGDRIISQYEGYEELKELDWDAYREKYDDIHRMDRILKAEGDSPDHYKVAKQADTVMLFFLFSDEELKRILEQLGYEWDDEMPKRNVGYYDERTSHGSTLSEITHAGVLAGYDPESSWERFNVALASDVNDVQGGTTREGIHMGVMSGTIDLAQRCYTGVHIEDDVLHFDPALPGPLTGMKFNMYFRGMPLQVTIDSGQLTVAGRDDHAERTVQVSAGGETRAISGQSRETFSL